MAGVGEQSHRVGQKAERRLDHDEQQIEDDSHRKSAVEIRGAVNAATVIVAVTHLPRR